MRRPLLLAASAFVALVAAGCGTPPELNPPGSVVPTPSATASPTPTLPPTPPTVPVTTPSTMPGFPDSPAIACAGRPSAEQVVALLKRRGLLPSSYSARTTVGPLCAGTWQWTVLDTSNGPLQAVTEGAPTSLRLVTAGTDVCSIEVRAAAPAGIRSATCDALPPGR